jgi:lysophospholipase L1-like esterase
MDNFCSRRRFLKSSAAFAAAFLGHEWLMARVACAAPVQSGARPFEMLVLGDSVMWGQGLREEAKFYSIVQRWLEAQFTDRAVHKPVVKAHSGATILPQEPCPRSDGEVNIGTPTIKSQVEQAAREYRARPGGTETVDLILVNGGINDLGFPSILNILSKEDSLKKATRSSCERMRTLLDDIASTFPRARVVVTNYYPIVSEQTPRETLLDLAAAAFTGPLYGRVREWIAKMLRRKGPHNWANDALFDKLVRRSRVWYEVSDATLKEAVDDLNKRRPFSSPSLAGPRALFARVAFKPEHAYGAPGTLLWRVRHNLGNPNSFLNLITEDHLFDARLGKCSTPLDEANQPACHFTGRTGIDLLTCRLAAAGHPNEAGAAKYADAIISQLKTVLLPTGPQR